MQKVFIFILAMLMAAPPLAMTSTPAQAQFVVRDHNLSSSPDYRHARRYHSNRHYRGYHRHHRNRYYRDRYYGRPYYGHNRRYYRRNNDAAIAAGVAGLAIGAIAAGAANNNRAYRGNGRDHHSYCYSRYRSYDARSGTFVGYDGRRHYCRSPY